MTQPRLIPLTRRKKNQDENASHDAGAGRRSEISVCLRRSCFCAGAESSVSSEHFVKPDFAQEDIIKCAQHANNVNNYEELVVQER